MIKTTITVVSESQEDAAIVWDRVDSTLFNLDIDGQLTWNIEESEVEI